MLAYSGPGPDPNGTERGSGVSLGKRRPRRDYVDEQIDRHLPPPSISNVTGSLKFLVRMRSWNPHYLPGELIYMFSQLSISRHKPTLGVKTALKENRAISKQDNVHSEAAFFFLSLASDFKCKGN